MKISKKPKSPRLLFYDIETSHNIVATFNLFEHGPINHQAILQERFIICASWKWSDESKVHSVSILDGKEGIPGDRVVVQALHKVLSEADAIVGHYADNFDIKFFNTRALANGLQPIHDVIQIDTYKIAKRKFKFNSNRLDYIAKFLGFEGKKHLGLDCWLSCLSGDRSAIKQMLAYNRHDVVILEQIYRVLAPFVPSPINHQLFNPNAACPRCGGSDVMCRGWAFAKTRRYQRFQCKSCTGWFQSHKSEPLEVA